MWAGGCNVAPQRLTEYMLVVTTSGVATAATDTASAAAPVSSSHSHFSLSLVFSMLIQCGHGCLLELRTLALKMTTARSVRFFVNLGLGLVFMVC
jgi:hypothetical protein